MGRRSTSKTEANMEEQRPWHRLFGLSWTDFFRGLPVTVDLERDLSVKKQLLDVVLIRKDAAVLSCRLPDGFEELATYNLVSFKSHQEKLSAWTLEELLGHYVNLRKQVSPSMDEPSLLSQEEFRLFAVSVRFPRNLADENIAMRQLRQGVYEVEALSRRLRLIVVNQLPLEEHNALLHLFSASGESFAYGARHYRLRSAETSSLLFQLFQRYREEALTMPDMLEELTRETIDQILKNLPVEKRLEGVPVEKRLEGVPVEKRLEGVPVEELLAGLSPQTREALARRLKDKESPQGSD
jgi:hypothetical protein